MAFSKHLKQTEPTIMSTLEKAQRESHARGRAEGQAAAQAAAQAAGQAHTLGRLLTKRFGPMPAEFAARMQAASLPDLDIWTDRLLDAKSLSDVFATT